MRLILSSLACYARRKKIYIRDIRDKRRGARWMRGRLLTLDSSNADSESKLSKAL